MIARRSVEMIFWKGGFGERNAGLSGTVLGNGRFGGRFFFW